MLSIRQSLNYFNILRKRLITFNKFLVITIWIIYLLTSKCFAADLEFEYEISRKNLNRINFSVNNLNINTISSAQLKVDKKAIYVLPDSDEPITIFVSEPEGKLNYLVTLIPTDIKSQDIFVPLPSGYQDKSLNNTQHNEANKTANNYEEDISLIVKEFWFNLLNNDDDLLRNGIEITDFESSSVKICGSSLNEELVSIVQTDKYRLYLLAITNPLNISTNITCSNEYIAYSVLNTNELEANGSKYVLVIDIQR
jgi:hypothetical protein